MIGRESLDAAFLAWVVLLGLPRPRVRELAWRTRSARVAEIWLERQRALRQRPAWIVETYGGPR